MDYDIYTRHVGHRLTCLAHTAHIAVCPHGWKQISQGPSHRKQLPVTCDVSVCKTDGF